MSQLVVEDGRLAVATMIDPGTADLYRGAP